MSETPLLDAMRKDPNRITEEGVVLLYGVPIYSFVSMPKGGLKEECPFKPCCYGWISNRHKDRSRG